jgi:hypothetical protein
MSIRVGTAKQAQMVMGMSEYELLRAQMGMGMGIPAHFARHSSELTRPQYAEVLLSSAV